MKRGLFIFFIISILFLSSGIVWGYELPLPEYTRKELQQEVSVNNIPYTMFVYQSQLPSQEVISFYKQRLSEEGFILFSEDKPSNVLIFSRPQSKDGVMLRIEDRPDGSTYISVSYWKGNLCKQTKRMAALRKMGKDTPGRDIPGIPRYPGSVRVMSTEYGLMDIAVYATTDTKQQVLSFYKSQMVSQGWKQLQLDSLADKNKRVRNLLSSTMISLQRQMLMFKKGDILCGIGVGSSSRCAHCYGQEGSLAGTTVTITKFHLREQR